MCVFVSMQARLALSTALISSSFSISVQTGPSHHTHTLYNVSYAKNMDSHIRIIMSSVQLSSLHVLLPFQCSPQCNKSMSQAFDLCRFFFDVGRESGPKALM